MNLHLPVSILGLANAVLVHREALPLSPGFRSQTRWTDIFLVADESCDDVDKENDVGAESASCHYLPHSRIQNHLP